MRLRIPTNLLRSQRLLSQSKQKAPLSAASIPHHGSFFDPSRSLAQVHPNNDLFLTVSFTGSPPTPQEPQLGQRPDNPPPDERTIKLGKTLRTLQPRLPSLLSTPLPNDILSPHISLHLFPSTHPHLPTVSGRVAYHAALWTSPITWGRVPIVGNITLDIQSERMVKNGAPHPLPDMESRLSKQSTGEKLIVRWRTCGKTKGLGMGKDYKGIGARQRVDKITQWLGGDARDDEEFCGLFVFEFDEEGRVVNHIIERAEGGEGWDNGVGRVVGLTDWLLGRFGGKERGMEGLALGCCAERPGRLKRRGRL